MRTDSWNSRVRILVRMLTLGIVALAVFTITSRATPLGASEAWAQVPTVEDEYFDEIESEVDSMTYMSALPGPGGESSCGPFCRITFGNYYYEGVNPNRYLCKYNSCYWVRNPRGMTYKCRYLCSRLR